MAEKTQRVILCIDDDKDFLIALRAILEAHGYKMVEAASAEEGLEAYRRSRPDLVIVDLMMEEIDSGTSFVRQLKADGAAVPIYMLSSIGDSLDRTADYAQLGLNGIFQKPIEPERLLSTLKAKLG